MGFDPQVENQKKADAAAKVPTPRLDPAFPWTAIAFDLVAFNVLNDPPEPPADKAA